MKQFQTGVRLCIIAAVLCTAFFALNACSGNTASAGDVKSEATGTPVSADNKIEDHAPAFDITTRKDHPPLNGKKAFMDYMLKNTKEDKMQLSARWDRAASCIVLKDLTREEVVIAFLRTPREYFARKKNWNNAYKPNYFDIGYGQTISGPHLVARMTCELDLKPEHRVLEIGTGSGYQSAVLAQLSNHVYTIEVIKPLGDESDAIYTDLAPRYPELGNITRKVADGYFGWEKYAPFDRIIVTCGIDHIPPALIKQLKSEGLMLIPVGPISHQHVLKIIKHVDARGNVTLDKSDIYNGREVPFVNFTSDGKTAHSISRDKPVK